MAKLGRPPKDRKRPLTRDEQIRLMCRFDCKGLRLSAQSEHFWEALGMSEAESLQPVFASRTAKAHRREVYADWAKRKAQGAVG